MAKEESLKLKGSVTQLLPNAQFKVQLEVGNEIICTISGKIRRHNINILLGDEVDVEMSHYDLTKGRITYRYK
jgi:translation initiation factor IF-1